MSSFLKRNKKSVQNCIPISQKLKDKFSSSEYGKLNIPYINIYESLHQQCKMLMLNFFAEQPGKNVASPAMVNIYVPVVHANMHFIYGKSR